MSKRRVVVTGLGTINPLGVDVNTSWKACIEGQSGIVQVPSFADTGIPSLVAGKIVDFDPSHVISAKELRRLDVFTQAGLVAAEEAMRDAAFDLEKVNLDRFGVAVGSGIGGIHTILDIHKKYMDGGYRKVSPFFIPATIINMVAGHISIRYGLKGPNISIVTACTTGSHNIGQAYRMIQFGDADLMVAGGTEMASHDLCVAAFAAAKALSTNFNDMPEKASRPWDKDRDGFVIGEGSGMLVLEEYEHAKARGAKIYGEVIGFGMSADAYHITQPSGTGGIHAMQNALNDAQIPESDIDYINAHATSTPLGDSSELDAIKTVFTNQDNLAVSSTKSMTGHLLGAAGAVEAIFSLLALGDGILPPTINLDNPDDNCDINLVPHVAQEKQLNKVLSNSFGFGGTNASLIFSKL